MSIFAYVYDNDDDGNENRLTYWLRLDHWSLDEFAALIADIDPDKIIWKEAASGFASVTRLTGETILSSDTDEDEKPNFGLQDADVTYYIAKKLASIYDEYYDLRRLLGRAVPVRESATPREWIELAKLKKIPIPWLHWAEERDLIECPNVSMKVDVIDNRSEKTTSGKSETSYLNIIGGLLKVILEVTDKDGNRFSQFDSQKSLIQAINDYCGTEGGLSQSNLEKKFAAAKRSIEGR